MKKILVFILTIFIFSCSAKVSIKNYNGYAYKLLDQKLYREAIFYLKNAKKQKNLTKKEKVKIYNNLAICYEAMGETNKAEEYYKKALDIDRSKPIKDNYEDFKKNNN